MAHTRQHTYKDFAHANKYTFQADFYNELYSDYDVKSKIFWDKKHFNDIVGVVHFKGEVLCFAFRNGLVYNKSKDKLLQSYFISQHSECKPTVFMTDAFFYHTVQRLCSSWWHCCWNSCMCSLFFCFGWSCSSWLPHWLIAGTSKFLLFFFFDIYSPYIT